MRRAGLLAAALLAVLSQAGCVERFLAIHSDPPGAAVYLDGEKVGRITHSHNIKRRMKRTVPRNG
jgi:hypothetical protein